MSTELTPANASKEANMTANHLEVANVYLRSCDIDEAARSLGIPRDHVAKVLESRPVIRYIDRVFAETGYRNKNKLFGLLDTIIDSKLEEVEESEVYTNKDLLDVLQLVHKMKMDEMKLQMKAEELRVGKSPASVTNVQNNYGALMEELMRPK